MKTTKTKKKNKTKHSKRSGVDGLFRWTVFTGVPTTRTGPDRGPSVNAQPDRTAPTTKSTGSDRCTAKCGVWSGVYIPAKARSHVTRLKRGKQQTKPVRPERAPDQTDLKNYRTGLDQQKKITRPDGTHRKNHRTGPDSCCTGPDRIRAFGPGPLAYPYTYFRPPTTKNSDIL